jgi:hypothetical protein
MMYQWGNWLGGDHRRQLGGDHRSEKDTIQKFGGIRPQTY